jgi:DNA-binding transcriptional LysR family regulator
MRSLDLDQLRTFVVAADLKSFTAAGDCLNATQSAVSLRIAKLEGQVGRILLARTPRAVSLTPDGARFLAHARGILAAHDAALAQLAGPDLDGRAVLRLAVSDHAAGASLSAALGSLKASLPDTRLEVTVGTSAEMRTLYDAAEADVAIVRQDAAERRDGDPLFADPLCWAAAPGLHTFGASPAAAPVPLVVMRGFCGVKAAATDALDQGGIRWRCTFLGGSVMALQAAVKAALGVGVFGLRNVPRGTDILGAREGLPPLPTGDVVMHTRLSGSVRRAIAAAFQAAGVDRG